MAASTAVDVGSIDINDMAAWEPFRMFVLMKEVRLRVCAGVGGDAGGALLPPLFFLQQFRRVVGFVARGMGKSL